MSDSPASMRWQIYCAIVLQVVEYGIKVIIHPNPSMLLEIMLLLCDVICGSSLRK